MTLLDFLTEALIVSNIIGPADGPPQDNETTQALQCLTGTVDTWTADPAKIFTSGIAAYTLIPNQQLYKIGPAAVGLALTPPITVDFNAPRPMSFLWANLIDLSNPAYPIRTPMDIYDDALWANIRLQNSPTPNPVAVYLDGSFPINQIYLHGVPSAANQIEVYSEQALTFSSALTDTLQFPPGYYEGLLYSTAGRLYARFSRPADPVVIALARDAMARIDGRNLVTPRMRLDSGLPNGRPPYFDARVNRQL